MIYTETYYKINNIKDALLAVKIKEIIAILEKDGWYQVRQTGSHRQFNHPSKKGTVTIAGKESAHLAPGTLLSILKQAGLKKDVLN